MKVEKAKIVKKPWGREVWFAMENEYGGKILEMKKGHRSSLHYHRLKKETMYVLSGKVLIQKEDGTEFTLKKDHSIILNPGDTHRIIPLEDTIILEAGTSEFDDVVRLKDDYKR